MNQDKKPHWTSSEGKFHSGKISYYICVSVNCICACSHVCNCRRICHGSRVEVGTTLGLGPCLPPCLKRGLSFPVLLVYTRLPRFSSLPFSSCCRSSKITLTSYQDQLFHRSQGSEHRSSHFHGKCFPHS